MSQKGKCFNQRYYRNINTLSLCRPGLLSGTNQSEHVEAGKNFKQRYYRNINNLSSCRPMLLSGNIQYEYVASEKMVQTTIISEQEQFKTLKASVIFG